MIVPATVEVIVSLGVYGLPVPSLLVFQRAKVSAPLTKFDAGERTVDLLVGVLGSMLYVPLPTGKLLAVAPFGLYMIVKLLSKASRDSEVWISEKV